uniref:Uncharacterized protein n=1 Tax=Neobodo designis TaxID=312471 RepID=A0A7S1L286_NEODS
MGCASSNEPPATNTGRHLPESDLQLRWEASMRQEQHARIAASPATRRADVAQQSTANFSFECVESWSIRPDATVVRSTVNPLIGVDWSSADAQLMPGAMDELLPEATPSAATTETTDTAPPSRPFPRPFSRGRQRTKRYARPGSRPVALEQPKGRLL